VSRPKTRLQHGTERAPKAVDQSRTVAAALALEEASWRWRFPQVPVQRRRAPEAHRGWLASRAPAGGCGWWFIWGQAEARGLRFKAARPIVRQPPVASPAPLQLIGTGRRQRQVIATGYRAQGQDHRASRISHFKLKPILFLAETGLQLQLGFFGFWFLAASFF
jgi:hypothetical protein